MSIVSIVFLLICQQKFVRIVWLHQYYWYGWSQDSNIAPAKCPINHCTFICQTNNTRWIVVKTQTNPQLNHKKLGLTNENEKQLCIHYHDFEWTMVSRSFWNRWKHLSWWHSDPNKHWNWLTDSVHSFNVFYFVFFTLIFYLDFLLLKLLKLYSAFFCCCYHFIIYYVIFVFVWNISKL